MADDAKPSGVEDAPADIELQEFPDEETPFSDGIEHTRGGWRMSFSEFARGVVPEGQRGQYKGAVREFYEDQTELVKRFHETLRDHSDDSMSGPSLLQFDGAVESVRRQKTRHRKMVSLLLRVTLYVNVVLFGMKVFVSVQSGSVAVISSAVDSFMDLFAGAVIYVSERAAKRQSQYEYPVGATRLQPVGVIVVSSIMGSAAFQVVIEAIRVLEEGAGPLDLHALELVLLILVVVIKFVLWLACRGLADYSAAMRATAQDHINDVMTNTIGTVAVAVARIPSMWWIDPVAGIVLSLFIVYNWASVGMESMQMLVGRAADPHLLQELTLLTWHHHHKIKEIDTVRGYYVGERIYVEIDVVLDADMPLREAHDIGEALQFKVESLDQVERAFVHLDYESLHKPEH